MLFFSAQSSGLLCEENDGQSGPTVKYVGYCQFHWNKKVCLGLSRLIFFTKSLIVTMIKKELSLYKRMFLGIQCNNRPLHYFLAHQ